MRPSASTAAFFATPRGARVLFIFLTVAGFIAFAASPTVKRRLGLNQFDLWFADSYAVLAAVDAHRAGLDTNVSNPLDLFERPHSYTDWWFALGPLGLTREHNFLVGASWILAFLGTVWLTLRPADLRSAAYFSLLVLSPPVLLAFNRANNDLVIFALLGLAALCLRPLRTWSWLPALALLVLATGLKFYPVVGAVIFLLLRPTRRLLIAAGVSVVVLALVMHNIWPTLFRGQFPLPPSVYIFGSSTLLRDLGYTGHHVLLISASLIACAGLVCAGSRFTTGVAVERGDYSSRVLFLLGSTTLLACFLAGNSYSYRWIFALWLAPWLLATSRDPAVTLAHRRLAATTAAALLALSWFDGIFCFTNNSLFGAMPAEQLHRWQHLWRLFTQPLTWLFMILLAGWIADAALVTARSLRASPSARPAT